MSDPTWASVFTALRDHAEIAFGMALGLVVTALFVRFSSKSRSARHAVAGLGMFALLELGLGFLVRFLPVASPYVDPSPERDAVLAAAFQRVEIGMLGVVALALVGVLMCLRHLAGARFALLVFSLGLAGQALWLEVAVRDVLGAFRSAAEHRELERRAIAKCLETEELHLSESRADSLGASVLEGAQKALGVERISVRRLRAYDTFPYHCLASTSEVWCFAYGTSSTAPLEKLVREHPFTSEAHRLTDGEVVDWVAFALGVYVWHPSSTRSVTDGEAAPARVERDGSRIRLDFWERHPLIPGFGVQLRHTEVLLDGGSVKVTRGPMTETLKPDWDRDSL